MKEKLINKFYYLTRYWGLRQDIKDFFSPKQKWLTKKIPNGWCDKVELIRIVAFESIVHFIEEENALSVIEWGATPEHKKAIEEIVKAYDNIKKIELMKKESDQMSQDDDIQDYFDNMFENDSEERDGMTVYIVKDPTPEQKEAIQGWRDFDAKIEAMEQEIIEIAAKYRNYLWT
ncbi:hypothetical protein N9955_00285 [bacterium]|nr:hypothetical protein [bacterium]